MRWLKKAWRSVVRRFKKPQPKPPIRPITVGTQVPLDIKKDYERLLGEGIMFKKIPANIIECVTRNRHRFLAVEDATFVPWWVVAFITIREAGFDWKKYRKTGELDFDWNGCLHNGQRWDRVTTIVPKGLGPWRSWEAAAIDAMNRRRRPSSWSIVDSLWFLEQYNGLGYRKYHEPVKSPYIWGYTNRYTKGGYASDGKWSNNYVNKQIGAVAFMKAFNIL